jgi:hypothetical protein
MGRGGRSSAGDRPGGSRQGMIRRIKLSKVVVPRPPAAPLVVAPEGVLSAVLGRAPASWSPKRRTAA